MLVCSRFLLTKQRKLLIYGIKNARRFSDGKKHGKKKLHHLVVFTPCWGELVASLQWPELLSHKRVTLSVLLSIHQYKFVLLPALFFLNFILCWDPSLSAGLWFLLYFYSLTLCWETSRSIHVGKCCWCCHVCYAGNRQKQSVERAWLEVAIAGFVDFFTCFCPLLDFFLLDCICLIVQKQGYVSYRLHRKGVMPFRGISHAFGQCNMISQLYRLLNSRFALKYPKTAQNRPWFAFFDSQFARRLVNHETVLSADIWCYDNHITVFVTEIDSVTAFLC